MQLSPEPSSLLGPKQEGVALPSLAVPLRGEGPDCSCPGMASWGEKQHFGPW